MISLTLSDTVTVLSFFLTIPYNSIHCFTLSPQPFHFILSIPSFPFPFSPTIFAQKFNLLLSSFSNLFVSNFLPFFALLKFPSPLSSLFLAHIRNSTSHHVHFPIVSHLPLIYFPIFPYVLSRIFPTIQLPPLPS
jgi:hypothetical protein